MPTPRVADIPDHTPASMLEAAVAGDPLLDVVDVRAGHWPAGY